LKQRDRDKEAVEEIDISTPVAVAKAVTGVIRETLTLNGSVRAVNEVTIFSTVPGKIKKIMAGEGERVRKDQALAFVERDQAGLKFADAPIESTINGLVKQVMTETGASVTPATPLFSVVDMDSVEIIVNIPEKEIPRIDTGQRAEISLIAYPDSIFSGVIYKMSPVVDPLSRTREARILAKNPDHTLKPGMFGSVQILIKTLDNVIIIPNAAVIDREEQQLAFIVKDGKAQEVHPAIDIIEGESLSVSSGIEEGDLVVIIGQHNLSHNDKVTIVEEIE
ncbi:MAG: efflux RND transporter periplasmic adaptor subunit, partial [Spirochaeta sp.]|nr:efflux RND transporter periplasmic adaptor subunit [Spirochaeta sp.]